MSRKNRTTFLSVFTSVVVFFASLSLYFSWDFSSVQFFRPSPLSFQHVQVPLPSPPPLPHPHVSTYTDLQPDFVLLPDWEILLIFPPNTPAPTVSSDSGDNQLTCLFRYNQISPATSSGILPFTNRSLFKCTLPNRIRRFWPIRQPILTKYPEIGTISESPPELSRWSFLTYESLSTKDDVILFVKGVNNRQGKNRPVKDLHCVFFDAVSNSVTTAVFSSNQEVFRCRHPNNILSAKVSLEILNEKKVVPSVAYYTPSQRNVVETEKKALLCACTMVYNVAKFLTEWVTYHTKIGVEKFLLYDNGSDDDLQNVVEKLVEKGFNVMTILWPWSKTQEAGFSHCATYANDICTWMAYMDVDEFIFSESWMKAPHPSRNMLTSLLPKIAPASSARTILSPIARSLKNSKNSRSNKIGQIMIYCYEFGASGQKTHPIEGVMQGYTCRRHAIARHKSIVLLDAIDYSLLNVIHHFVLKRGFKGKKLGLEKVVVNHYKYQAWSEFKTKFRRRVSAYVIDWKQEVNPMSKDRTPGLGFEPTEPKGWDKKFCEVHDYRLKELTKEWFGSEEKTAWQDE